MDLGMRSDPQMYQQQMQQHRFQLQQLGQEHKSQPSYAARQPNVYSGHHSHARPQSSYMQQCSQPAVPVAAIVEQGSDPALTTSSVTAGNVRTSSPTAGLPLEWSEGGNPFVSYDNTQSPVVNPYQALAHANSGGGHVPSVDSYVGSAAGSVGGSFRVNGSLNTNEVGVGMNLSVAGFGPGQHASPTQSGRFMQNPSQNSINVMSGHGASRPQNQPTHRVLHAPVTARMTHYMPNYAAQADHGAAARTQQLDSPPFPSQMSQGFGSNSMAVYRDSSLLQRDPPPQPGSTIHYVEHPRMYQSHSVGSQQRHQPSRQGAPVVSDQINSNSQQQGVVLSRSQEVSRGSIPHLHGLRTPQVGNPSVVEGHHPGQTSEQTITGPESQFWSTVINPSARAAAAAVGVNGEHAGSQNVSIRPAANAAGVFLSNSPEAAIASPVSPVFGGLATSVLVDSRSVSQKFDHASQGGVMDDQADHAGMSRMATDVACPDTATGSYNAGGSSNQTKALFPCDICGRKFGQKGSLGRHRRAVHEGVRNFPCSTCGYRFSQRYDLQKHIMSVHHHQRPFPCQVEGCKAAFARRAKLRKHVATVHDKRRDYVCEICNFAFGEKSNRNKHIRAVHHGVRAYPCHLCGATFKERGHRTKHLTTQHGVAPGPPVAVPSPQSSTSTPQTHASSGPIPELRSQHSGGISQPPPPPLQSLSMLDAGRVR